MDCPACQSKLNEVDVCGLRVDLCQNGCGGIWFDRFELNQTNTIHAHTIQNLFKASRAQYDQKIMTSQRRCPRDSTIMQQHYYSIKKEVEVDTCPCCAGIWLDRHELDNIQQQYESAREKEEEANLFIEKAFNKILASRSMP